MLKYRGRKKELQEYIQKNEKYFSSVDAETYQALCSFLNMEKGIKEVEAMQKEERVNMCQALEEWHQDALKEGEVKGRESGRGEGTPWQRKFSACQRKDGRKRRLQKRRELIWKRCVVFLSNKTVAGSFSIW